MKRQTIQFAMVWFLVACSGPKDPELKDIPSFIPTFNIVVNKPDAFDGYILLRESASPGAQFAINALGKIVWYQLSDTSLLRVFRPYKKSYLGLYTKTGIQEISYQGDTIINLKYGEGGFDRFLHHDITKDTDGNLLALSKEFIPLDLSKWGGDVQDTVRTDGIIKLTVSGEKVWHWRIDQVMDPLVYPKINRFKKDWGHANSIEVDDDGNYLVSWRDFNQVWKIDNHTGKVLWKYGVDPMSPNAPFFQQHSITHDMEGNYLVFDNGSFRIRKKSRAVAFRNVNGTIKTVYTIDLPDSLFSFKQGSVYQFEKNRYLFSCPMVQTLVVTDAQGKILWMAKSKHGFYRAYFVEKHNLIK